MIRTKGREKKQYKQDNEETTRFKNTNVVTLGRRIVTFCEQSDDTVVVGISSGLLANGVSLPPEEPSKSFRCEMPL